jgi:radical SAM protein with 4Fe4S-binding SPASM domain
MDSKKNLVTETTNRSALRRRTTFSEKRQVDDRSQRILVNPFERNKILRWRHLAEEILEGKMPHPLMAVVYPSYVCNHDCHGCSYRELNKNENLFSDSSNFSELLRSIRGLGVKSIEFSGGGEPTLHPQFDELAEYAANQRFELGLLTNGSLLSGRTADLIVSHFTYVRVNLDASDVQVYNQIHRPPESYGFQTILDNLEEVNFKRNRQNSRLTLGAKVLICQANMNFIEDIINLSKDVGCDYVQFKLMRNAQGSLLPEQAGMVDDLIEILRERYYPFSVFGGALGSKTDRKCWLSPIHLVVDPLGDVYPCSHYQHRRESTRMGNLFKEPLEEIWFGQRHKEVIRALKVEECNLYDCRWHCYNEIMRQVLEEDKMHLNFI